MKTSWYLERQEGAQLYHLISYECSLRKGSFVVWLLVRLSFAFILMSWCKSLTRDLKISAKFYSPTLWAINAVLARFGSWVVEGCAVSFDPFFPAILLCHFSSHVHSLLEFPNKENFLLLEIVQVDSSNFHLQWL